MFVTIHFFFPWLIRYTSRKIHHIIGRGAVLYYYNFKYTTIKFQLYYKIFIILCAQFYFRARFTIIGMGSDFYKKFDLVKKNFSLVDETLGFPLSKIILEGPD